MNTYLTFLRKYGISVILLSILWFTVLLVLIPNVLVWFTGRSCSHYSSNALESQNVGIVLGTSAKVSGRDNLFFQYRMDAAAELFKAGKVQCLIVSGANPSKYYNEPLQMMKALIKRGVPKNQIVLDFAGLRTLDTVMRAQKVFGVQKAIFISQAFHNHRALFIARHIGMSASGFNAPNVPVRYGMKTRLREVLARVKMILDLHVLHTQPKFLGEKQSLPIK